MKFSFRKIASVLASAVMLSSTAGIALAANYPAPLVVTGAGDGAVIVTSGSHAGAVSDWDGAVTLQRDLQGSVTATATTTEGGISGGEAYALYTSGTRIYYNDSLNKVKQILTDSELPIILKDQTFSGNVDADVTQTISFTSWPYVNFAKQPTGDEDPQVGLTLYTTKGKDLYNLSVIFDKAVRFNHTDSESQDIILFGQEFTVGVDTDDDDLILYKSSQTLQLSVGGSAPNPSQTVTVEGKEYTVELTAATDTSATVKVTDSTGKSDTKEITEGDSKKIVDLEVAANLADESTATNTISAEITVGAQKVKLTEGSEVKLGSDETAVDGTNVNFAGGGAPSNVTKLIIQVAAPDSSGDAIIPGSVFIDPVFGTLKIDFVGLNIEETSTARETLEIKSTQDTATLKLKTYTGNEKTITWYNNESDKAVLANEDREYIRVRENAAINYSEWAVVGNEDEGYLVELKEFINDTSTYSDDIVKFVDVFDTTKEFKATITAEGTGSVTIGGKEFGVVYLADKSSDKNTWRAWLDYPDSTTAGNIVLFPTIETSKGARVAFYEPQVFNLSDYRGLGGQRNVTGLVFPDGDGYETTITVAAAAGNDVNLWNLTVGGVVYPLNTSGVGTGAAGQVAASLNVSVSVSDGNTFALKYNITSANNAGPGGAHGQNINITLMDGAGVPMRLPGLIIFEEEDDNNDRMALIVQVEGAGTSSDEVGVEDVEMPASLVRGRKTITNYEQLESDDDLYKYIDLWGTFVTIDKSESSQYTAVISYPDEQIYAQIYAAEVAASITGGGVSGGGGNILVVKDSEVDSVKDRNLVVVGGSCINSAAAKVLGITYPTCGADFTTATKVGAGQYLIKAVASPYNAAKTAILVAGYEAAETKLAATKLKEVPGHATDVGTEKIYPQTSA